MESKTQSNHGGFSLQGSMPEASADPLPARPSPGTGGVGRRYAEPGFHRVRKVIDT